MIINKVELQEALEKVKPALASREIIEQSNSFAFIGDRVVTYNDEISISHPVEGLDIVGAIRAETLYSFLNKTKENDIEIEQEESQIIIKAGKSKAGLVLEEEIRLPIEEVGEIGKWQDFPKQVLEAIKFCHPICSRDMSRPLLTCVFVSGDSVKASNSYQIVKYRLDEKMKINNLLLPATAAAELVKYPNIQEIAKGENWIHFRTEDDTIFSSRVYDGEFPEIDAFLEFDGVEISFPEVSADILDKAKIFSKGDFSADHLPIINVEISDRKIHFSASNEHAWFEEFARIKYKGETIKFTTGIEFLDSLLRHSLSCLIGEDRIKFSGENWEHVISTTE